MHIHGTLAGEGGAGRRRRGVRLVASRSRADRCRRQPGALHGLVPAVPAGHADRHRRSPRDLLEGSDFCGTPARIARAASRAELPSAGVALRQRRNLQTEATEGHAMAKNTICLWYDKDAEAPPALRRDLSRQRGRRRPPCAQRLSIRQERRRADGRFHRLRHSLPRPQRRPRLQAKRSVSFRSPPRIRRRPTATGTPSSATAARERCGWCKDKWGSWRSPRAC